MKCSDKDYEMLKEYRYFYNFFIDKKEVLMKDLENIEKSDLNDIEKDLIREKICFRIDCINSIMNTINKELKKFQSKCFF
ncbi:MAG: hypothetical protein ACTSRP_18970 [Candidatus Helarchaeota archaeon]